MKVLKEELGTDNELNANTIYEYFPNAIRKSLICLHSRSILKIFYRRKMQKTNFYPSSTGFTSYTKIQVRQESCCVKELFETTLAIYKVCFCFLTNRLLILYCKVLLDNFEQSAGDKFH